MIKWWNALSAERRFNLVYGLITLAIVSGVLAATGGLRWWSFALVAVIIGIWSWWGRRRQDEEG